MSNELAQSLPWADLQHTEGDIPWEALNQFADALAADSALWEQLREVYDNFMEDPYAVHSYENYYVPAIVALAASRLAEDARRAIGRFLVDELVCAGDRDDEGMLEVLEAACGSIGPPVLSAVLDWIERRRRYHSAAFNLWCLTELAAQCTDESLRGQVAACCQRALERAERGKMEPMLASCPAWTLARMGHRESIPLIQRVYRKTCDADTKEALLFMEGKLDYEPTDNAWEEPVSDWLAEQCRFLREWYERGGSDADYDDDWEEDEDGEEEEDGWEEGSRGEPFADHPKPVTIHSPHSAVGRNDPCPCGSGKKFKKCCAKKGAGK